MTKLREYKSEVFFDCRNTLGEGLLWDVRSETLYWVDILEKQIFVWKEGGKSFQTLQLSNYPGCLAVCEDNRLLVAHEQGLSFLNPEDDRMELINAIESDKKDNRFNDGKCDPSGRFWAGSMRMDATGREGALYVVNRDFSVDKKIGEVSISNGLAWSQLQKRMYYIDTGDNDIKIYQYDDLTA
jgi:sugar lactone lactonase YvrE